MKEALQKNINETFNELDNILFSFTPEQLNTVPFEGSWTAGQTTDHICKAFAGLSGLLTGPTEASNRQPDEKVKPIDDLFLNFDIKLQAPEFIIPGNGPFDKEELLATISNGKKDMLDGTTMDLSALVLSYELPTFGKFTRLEWINFYIAHTQRHTHQIKKIFRALK